MLRIRSIPKVIVDEPVSREESRPRRENSFLHEVLAGLRQEQKALASKWLYDARGLDLHARICAQEDHYPTRTERAILYRYAAEIALELGDHTQLVEYGNGSTLRTRILLAAMDSSTVYVPIGLSRTTLVAAAIKLGLAYPWLEIHPLVANYTRPFELPQAMRPVETTAILFPGSIIGEFSTQDAMAILRQARATVGEGGVLLLGVDLKKDAAVLTSAWDDPEGLNARFNLNLLSRMNAELGADFDLQGFQHRAIWNEEEGRLEAHLESLLDQTVHIGGEPFFFRRGETIHTRSACKYDLAEVRAMARMAGFEMEHVWQDSREWFAEVFLRSQPDGAHAGVS